MVAIKTKMSAMHFVTYFETAVTEIRANSANQRLFDLSKQDSQFMIPESHLRQKASKNQKMRKTQKLEIFESMRLKAQRT